MRSDPSRIVQQLFHAPVRAHPGKVNRAERDCDVIHTVAISIPNPFVASSVDLWDLACRWECKEKWNLAIDFNIVVTPWFKATANKVCLIINEIILWKELIL